MTYILYSIEKFHYTFVKESQKFQTIHPFIAYLAVVFGLPMALLAGIFLSVFVVMYPIACLFGWA